MTPNVYDELALGLAEMRQRFGDDAFANRRKLNGLLTDRLPEARREIRIVLDAIEDGVMRELASIAPDTLDMQIDRLAVRLENARGTREDIARQVVCACAYGLGIGDLPSRHRSAATIAAGRAPSGTATPPAGDWVGVSAVAATSGTAGHATGEARSAPPSASSAPSAARRWGRQIAYTLGVVVVTVTVLGIIGITMEEDEPPRDVVPGEETPRQEPRREAAPPEPPDSQRQAQDESRPPPQEYANEFSDFGVPAQATLQRNVGSPTPTSIPGARVVGTRALIDELRAGGESRFLLIDVLSGDTHPSIPGARHLPQAGSPGSFNDAVQRQVVQDLDHLTGGRKGFPLVFFCGGVNCWLSYNASLRAVTGGYSNVFWYRGGIEAWQAARQPLARLQ